MEGPHAPEFTHVGISLHRAVPSETESIVFTMVASQLLLASLFTFEAFGCDTHATGRILSTRQDAAANPVQSTRKYDYAASWNWVNLDPDAYGICQNGTQQSPIPLSLTQGLVRTILMCGAKAACLPKLGKACRDESESHCTPYSRKILLKISPNRHRCFAQGQNLVPLDKVAG